PCTGSSGDLDRCPTRTWNRWSKSHGAPPLRVTGSSESRDGRPRGVSVFLRLHAEVIQDGGVEAAGGGAVGEDTAARLEPSDVPCQQDRHVLASVRVAVSIFRRVKNERLVEEV